MPMVFSAPFRAQVITFSALLASEDERSVHLLCPVQAFRMYVKSSSQFQHLEQLFMCFGDRFKRLSVTKQKFSGGASARVSYKRVWLDHLSLVSTKLFYRVLFSFLLLKCLLISFSINC